MLYEADRRRRSRGRAHRGPARDVLRALRAEIETHRAGRASREELFARLGGLLSDERFLHRAVALVCTEGGRAAGPDGMQPQSLSEADRWKIARLLRDELLAGTYTPGDVKRVEIPKGSGTGVRTIAVPNVRDRAVGKAVQLLLEAVIDRGFRRFSFGFRPGRSAADAVAYACRRVRRAGYRAAAVADVAKAFDVLPHDRLAAVIDAAVPCIWLAGLIRAVAFVPGADRGVWQGSPASPLLLNLYLHAVIDARWAGQVALVRYADDILLLARSAGAATAGLDTLCMTCEAAGVPLKAGSQVIDWAADESADYLGYRLGQYGGRPTVRIAPAAYAKLGRRLASTIRRPGGYEKTDAVIFGWLASLGPCHRDENESEVLANIRSATAAAGVTELPTDAELRAAWEQAAAAHVKQTADHRRRPNAATDDGPNPGGPTPARKEDNRPQTTNGLERTAKHGQDAQPNPATGDAKTGTDTDEEGGHPHTPVGNGRPDANRHQPGSRTTRRRRKGPGTDPVRSDPTRPRTIAPRRANTPTGGPQA